MGFGFELPKSYTPGFGERIANQPNVEIDWDNSLVKTFKLRKFIYFGSGIPTDLVTGKTAGFTSDAGGSGVVNAGRAECSDAGLDAEDFGLDVFSDAEAGFSIGCRVTYNNTSQDHGLFDHITSAGTIRIWADTSGGNLRVGYFGPSPARYGDANVFSAGVPYSWGVTLDAPGGNYEICYGHRASDSIATSYTAPTGSLTSSYFAKTTETSKDSDAIYEFIALFARPVPPVIFEAFLKNPYQILKPVNTHLYFMSTGAPPAVTPIPPRLHRLGSQFATITAHRKGGVIE